jgi:antitoxin component YwqK of YwqJK toxin-antitoxin module
MNEIIKYYNSGNICSKGNYVNNVKQGRFIFYDDHPGNPIKCICYYNKGEQMYKIMFHSCETIPFWHKINI